MIRDPVHSILKYGGSLKTLATSPYFRYLVQYSEIYYKASPKALFYLVYECSPKFQPALMSEYLENPFNPMMFISYN